MLAHRKLLCYRTLVPEEIEAKCIRVEGVREVPLDYTRLTLRPARGILGSLFRPPCQQLLSHLLSDETIKNASISLIWVQNYKLLNEAKSLF